MIRSDKIKTALFGGVGFRNPTDTEFNIVTSANTASSSGLYFDDASNFVTIRNIKDCQSDRNIGNTDFNTYLGYLQNQVIDDVARSIIGEQCKMLFSQNIYPYEKDFSQTITPGSGFVAFEIVPKIINNIVAKIEYVELAFDSAVTFNIYLYNSNLKAPIKTQEVTTVANQATIVNLTDWFIADDATYKGGNFYAGYFEADLGSAKPIKKDFELANVMVQNDFYTINPVRLGYIDAVIDVDDNDYLEDTNGLNIGINIYRDYTQMLINNKSLLFPVIQYGMAAKVLDIIRTSIRSNITQRLNKEIIQDVEFELYGNPALGIEGVRGKYEQRLKAVKEVMFSEPLMSIGTLK